MSVISWMKKAWERLPNRRSDEKGYEENQRAAITNPIPLIYADEDPPNTKIVNYRFVIGRKPSGGYGVYQCNETGSVIPPGTEFYIFETGDIMQLGGDAWIVKLAKLVQPDDYEDPDKYDGQFVSVPEEITERTFEAGGLFDEEKLQQLAGLSLNTFDQVDSV